MCYIVPLTIILIINGLQKYKKIFITHLDRLNLLMFGGVTMLIVDHLWNGELFLVGPNTVRDLALGFAMSGVIIIAWTLNVLVEKKQALVKVQKTEPKN